MTRVHEHVLAVFEGDNQSRQHAYGGCALCLSDHRLAVLTEHQAIQIVQVFAVCVKTMHGCDRRGAH